MLEPSKQGLPQSRNRNLIVAPLLESTICTLNFVMSFNIYIFANDLKAIVEDINADCRFLYTGSRYITDPYPTNKESPISSWSIPVGCDAKPGDSGAPVFNNKGKVLGILWDGKLTKQFVSSESLIKRINSKSIDL